MKKLVIVVVMILVISLSAFALVGCKTETEELVIAMPDGAPALALAKLMQDTKELGGYNISYTIKDGTGIKSVVLSKEADIALLPMNIAAALYNGGVDIKLIGANVFGLLYLVGVDNLDDGYNSLIGEVVYNVGQGGTPDFVFKKLLSANGIEYVESDEKVAGKVALAYTSPNVLVPQFKTGMISYAVLGEPQATLALAGTTNKVLFDLQEEWQEMTDSDTLGYPQVGMVVKTSLLNKNPQLVKDIMDLVADNAQWILDNPKTAGNIILANDGMMPVELTRPIVERCNINFVDAATAKASIIDYLSVLKDFQPQSIGGKLPDDSFYNSFE